MICECCGKEHDGSFGSGRFCSISCANSRRFSKETKEKISKGVLKYHSSNKYTYICEKCGNIFDSTKTFKKNSHIYCNSCKQHREHYKSNINSILDISKRTITKLLKRANKSCSICGWNESTCDIHHIIPLSKGGTNNIDNLIIVCPNCHRVIHTTNKYNIQYLNALSIDKTFNNWKDYYHISN